MPGHDTTERVGKLKREIAKIHDENVAYLRQPRRMREDVLQHKKREQRIVEILNELMTLHDCHK